MIDLRQTPEYVNYLESLGWVLKRVNNINYAAKKLPIVGSVIKIQRPAKIDIETIKRLAEEFRAFQIIVEPINTNQTFLIKDSGFKLSKSPFIPSKSIHIDLEKTEKQILKEMHHKTRYNIKIAQREKLELKLSTEIDKFSDFWQECALKQRAMFLSQKNEIKNIYKSFEQKADLIFIYKNEELVAGILLIHSNKISYYMYAAASNKGKKLFAPTLAAWEALKISKKRGSKIFDFEGVYDERFPLKSWKGFSRFKKSFGGKEVEYPGAFTKLRIPI